MLKIVTFDSLEFKSRGAFQGCQARAEFTDGTSVSVIYGFGAYGEGPSGPGNPMGDDLYEAYFSDEEDPRGYQSPEQLDEEFLKRSIPPGDGAWVETK